MRHICHFFLVMQRREVGPQGGVVEMISLGSGEPWCVQARGGEVGSEIWAGREGWSEKQVVWFQANVDTEVP